MLCLTFIDVILADCSSWGINPPTSTLVPESQPSQAGLQPLKEKTYNPTQTFLKLPCILNHIEMFNNFPTLHFYIKKQKNPKSSPVVAFKRKGPLLYHLIHMILSATKLSILTWECMRRGSRWSQLWVATGSFWVFWLLFSFNGSLLSCACLLKSREQSSAPKQQSHHDGFGSASAGFA